MLLLLAFPLPLGVLAKALAWLVAEITNIVFFQRFSPEMERFSIIISARGSSRGRS